MDDERGVLWINLHDGSTLVDTGESIQLKGALTWTAALETAAAAERHGWKTCVASGNRAYKDAVAVACALRGIEVVNHKLSPRASAQLERLKAKQEAKQRRAPAPRVQLERHDSAKAFEEIQRLRRRAAAAQPEDERQHNQAPAYVPPWVKSLPKRRQQQLASEGRNESRKRKSED